MNTIDILRPGNEVDIAVTSGWGTRAVMSQILHMTGEALYLAVPESKEPLLTSLPSGTTLTLHIKSDHGLYLAAARVLDFARGDPPRLYVARPRMLERVERRQHIRVPVLIHPQQCEVHCSQSAGWLWLEQNLTIVDLSVGGALLQHHQPLAEGDTVRMQFTLPDGYGPIRVEARVIHSRIEQQADPATRLTGIVFTRVAMEDSEAILSYIRRQP